MTNIELLSEEIKKSGVTIKFLAEKLGISRYGLYNKLNGTTEFKVSEISVLTETLHLSREKIADIFFS